MADDDLDGFDPGAFASEATGEATANHASAEGAEEAAESSDSVGSVSKWREMLMQTDPHRRLDDVENPWDPERGAETRIYRGIQKMADFDGMPAIVDIVVGFAELVVKIDPASDDGDEPDAEDDPLAGMEGDIAG